MGFYTNNKDKNLRQFIGLVDHLYSLEEGLARQQGATCFQVQVDVRTFEPESADRRAENMSRTS